MIPIYAAASACTVLVSYFSDRRQSRGNFYIALQLTAMTGFVLASTFKRTHNFAYSCLTSMLICDWSLTVYSRWICRWTPPGTRLRGGSGVDMRGISIICYHCGTL